MITAVLDTNVIVGAAIGSEKATAGRILDAYFDGKYQLAFSPATSDELLHVLSLPMIRRRHGWSDDDILRFVLSLHVSATIGAGRLVVSPTLTRDVTDTKFLALAAEISMILASWPREMVTWTTSRRNLRMVENEAWQGPLR